MTENMREFRTEFEIEAQSIIKVGIESRTTVIPVMSSHKRPKSAPNNPPNANKSSPNKSLRERETKNHRIDWENSAVETTDESLQREHGYCAIINFQPLESTFLRVGSFVLQNP
jgi:hypothetical protein